MLNLYQPASLDLASGDYESQPLAALRAFPDQLLRTAFNLAFFILPDTDTALRIAIDALANLDLALSAQDKRLYYSPVGQFFSRQRSSLKLRNRVSVSELHLLQRLVLLESESHEKLHEMSRAGAVHKDELLVRFVKHLIRITVKRNSFYVALGLSRLLHSYSTAETADIYSVIIQDPARVKDDSYFRSCKRQLMGEFKLRFGALMKVTRVARGEERFESEPGPGSQAALVRRCLYMFTPWKTTCVIPDNFDAKDDELAELKFEGDDPDKEHPIEVNRMHSLIDPECYERISSALGLGFPEERMASPSFQTSNDEEDSTGGRADRSNPPVLSITQIDAALTELAERKERRKKLHPKLLFVIVDGVERAGFDPNKTTRVRLNVEESAEVFEVRARDGQEEVRIGIHMFNHYEQGADRKQFRIALEGGQKLSLGVTVKRDGNGEVQGASLDLEYRQKQRAATAWPSLHVVTDANRYLRKFIDSMDSFGPAGLKGAFEMSGSMSGSMTGAMSGGPAGDTRLASPSRQIAEILAREVLHAVDLRESHVRIARHLIKTAEQASILKNTEILNDLSRLLLALPLHEARAAGLLYGAICDRREGRLSESVNRLQILIEDHSSPAFVRTGAMKVLGMIYYGRHDLDNMLRTFEEGARFTQSLEKPDLCNFARMIIGAKGAYCEMGDPRRALSLSAQLEPIVEMTGHIDPLIKIQYLNNTGIFLARLGRVDEAVQYLQAAAQCPLARTYWSDILSSATEIKERFGKNPLSI